MTTSQSVTSSMSSSSPRDGSEILITGMSGRFPKSPSVKKFKENLYQKVDMLSSYKDRWNFSHPEVPPKLGIISDLDKFDAQFFAVHYKQGQALEPMVRILLECVCEAVTEAGINPRSLRDSKTGVFFASTISENEKEWLYNPTEINGYGVTGACRTMYSNRVSYWLGLRGPSYTTDAIDCGGVMVLEHAYQAIRRGYCDAAIVGCTNLCLHPLISIHQRRMGLLTMEDNPRPFTEGADGYARSESIVVYFLQKSKDAKRVYAQIVHAKTDYTSLVLEPDYFRYPSGEQMRGFLKQFYSETDVKPEMVKYVEACGIGIDKHDKEELEGLDEIYCPESRKDPLMIGTVKSNMGNSESASALCAVAKILMAYHTGHIAPNLHMENIRKDVDGVRKRHFKFVNETTPFDQMYTAVNCFSYSGINGHILLKKFDLNNVNPVKSFDFPRLVCVSGRVDESIEAAFTELDSKPLDERQIALLQSVHENEVPGFVVRGYNVLTTKDEVTTSLCKDQEYYGGEHRPVWFVYSGMGSQWTTMGVQLMRIPIFAAAIHKCHRILEPFGVDLLRILTEKDPQIYENILHSFVGIAAVQIGLTDILYKIGILPDNIIGHSVGELGCAYADGCLDAEQMILAAYRRGLVSLETDLIKGSMAAVGLGYNSIKSRLPHAIEVACRNSADSCTISGPAEPMKAFVAELTAQGIFAKEVPTSNIAYHSRYIAPAGDGLKKYMLEVIKEPKLRSERWISTSVPQSKWNENSAKYCSAEYLTNNLLSPVLFEESARLIPANAITIEIAPHGLLQAILKRSLSPNCVNVALTRRGHNDNAVMVLEAIGKLYNAGLQPIVQNLYPRVEYPVSVDTPMLSHILRWEHSEEWTFHKFKAIKDTFVGERQFIITTKDLNFEFLSGYVISGVNYCSPSALLVFVWETMGMITGVSYKKLSVEFQNVRFDAEIPIPSQDVLELEVIIQKASGKFEIVTGGDPVCSGQIFVKQVHQYPLNEPNHGQNFYESQDIYRMFALRGHSYRGSFRSLTSVNTTFTKAKIAWSDNWVTLLDGLMQMAMLNGSFVAARPKFIQRLSINTKVQRLETKQRGTNKGILLDATYYPEHHVTRTTGVELQDLLTIDQNLTKSRCPMLQKYELVPFCFADLNILPINALKNHIQTVVDNATADLKIVEFVDSEQSETTLKSDVHEILKMLPHNGLVAQVTQITRNSKDDWIYNLENANLIVLHELRDVEELNEILTMLPKDSFILIDQKCRFSPCSDAFRVVSIFADQILIRKVVNTDSGTTVHVTQDESWINQVSDALKDHKKVFLVSKAQTMGHLDLLDNICNGNENDCLKYFLLVDENAPAFDPKLPLYKSQIQRNLKYNVLKNGVWGSYFYSHAKIEPAYLEYSKLSMGSPGDEKSLVWLQTEPIMKTHRHVLVKVHFVRLSCEDLIKTQGQKTMASPETGDGFGASYSGITSNGDRVMGLVKSGAAGTWIEADPDLLWPVPDHWSLQEAATVPLAYAQALYCLTQRTTLKPGSKVLISSGAGPLGQAAIAYCLENKCEVFTTVNDARKKRLLQKLFPRLKESSICNPEKQSLEELIQRKTFGENCNIVISSAQGSMRKMLMECTRRLSYFLDIGVEDFEENVPLGMYFLETDRSYVAAIFSGIFKSDFKRYIQSELCKGISKGWVRPITSVVFEARDATRALRMISSRRYCGAVLLRLVNVSSPTLPAMPTWKCGDGVYAVICGKNNLGIEVAQKLVKLGARKIFLHTMQPKMPFLLNVVKSWIENKVKVTLSTEDLGHDMGCRLLFGAICRFGPLKGLFIISPTEELAKCDVVPKRGLGNSYFVSLLDKMSRKLCPDLEQFVVITSLPTANGRRFGDFVAEKICEQRFKAGLPGLAIQALVDKKMDSLNDFVKTEIKSSSLKESLKNLELLLVGKMDPIVAMHSTLLPANMEIYNSILKKLGISSDQHIDDEMKISNLGVNLTSAKTVCCSLKSSYGICLSPRRLQDMTMRDFKNIKTGKELNNTRGGLSLFFNAFDENETVTSEPLVWVPTIVSDADIIEDCYNGNDYLIVLPNMDGHRQNLLHLCRRLKLRALVCQYADNSGTDSIHDLAAQLTKLIINKIDIGPKFYILGYAFGSLLALEMAFLLEKQHGLTGKVFCLDGSPLVTKAVLESQIKKKSNIELQTDLLIHKCTIISKSRLSEEFKKELSEIDDWSTKREFCLGYLRSKTVTTTQFLRNVLEGAWKRIEQTRSYQPSGLKLKSGIVLLRTRCPLNIPKDYDLQRLTNKPLTVYELNSSQMYVPYDLAITNIINEELDESVLTKFEESNLCKKIKGFL